MLSAYPMAVLGPMLIFSGVELARAAGDVQGVENIAVALTTAVFCLAVNTGVGFLAGGAAWGADRFFVWMRRHPGLPASTA